MATTVHGSIEGQFVVVSGAVDLANHTAVTSVDTTITVTMPDGTTAPLQSTDLIQLVGGFTALAAGIIPQSVDYVSATQVKLRTTNPSAGAIDPANIAGGLTFLVSRR
jgi:hypothetical protein